MSSMELLRDTSKNRPPVSRAICCKTFLPLASAAEAAARVHVRIGEQHGIHQRVAALRRFDGALQRELAALVNTVGKDDHGLAALLLLHEFVGAEEDGVVEQRAAAAPAG